MSVRRLADEAVQPHDFAFTPENDAWFEGELKKYPEGRQRSAIIPALMKAQEQEGWVTKRAIEHIAERLDLPYIRALEVATFYTQFMLSPVGTRAHVQVCGTTPCMLRGSEELFAVCKSRIGPRPFSPNEAGTLSWEEVECQGACVNAPMVMIGKDTFEDLTPERLAEIIDAFDAGRGADVKPGPQIDRHLSAPIGGRTTLLDYDEIAEHAHDEAPLDGRADTGEADNVVPSEAARPDTHSQMTDPVYADPSPNAPNVDPEAEDAASTDPDPRESGVGGSSETSAGQGNLTETGFGETPDDLHPDLAQHAPASPYEAGEANREVAEAQASRSRTGAATGGVQKEYATETIHRDDPDKHVGDRDTEIGDAAKRRPATARAVGTEADVDTLQEQRNERTAIGADGVAAGDGAATDPKAVRGKQTVAKGKVGGGGRTRKGDDADGAGQSRPVDRGAVTSPGGVAAPPPRDPRAAVDQSDSSTAGAADGTDDPVRAAAAAPGGAATASGDPKGAAPASASEEGPESEPERLDSPRDGNADDLKMIWGVGPKLESMLNEMGFYHFDQIQGWGDAELNWVDRRLTGFRGRARRDKWVEQAAKLATGWRPDQGHGENPHE